jgi:hypothetical protein
MPAALRGFVTPLVALLLVGAVAAGPALMLLHDPYAPSRSDGKDIRDFDGVLLAKPAPHLVVPRPGGGFSRYFLTGRGKYGVKDEDMAAAGGWARVKGSLIYHDNLTLISVKGITKLETAPDLSLDLAALGQGLTLGDHTFQGEIVDTKCHLGAMRPGRTKSHRGCAVRCIAGGVPPMLLVQDADGARLELLLVGPDGAAINQEVLPFVAEPVEVKGEVERFDDLLVMHIDPAQIRRL